MLSQDALRVVASVVFSAIGFAAFAYGWKNRYWRPMAIGFMLMGYTYVFSNVLLLYGLGCALTALLYFWRE